MTAAEIVQYLNRNGYKLGLTADGLRLTIDPALDSDALRARVKARRADIIAYLRELGAPAATMHAFVALAEASSASVQEYGVCIACGYPWAMHGEPAVEQWQRIDHSEAVPLRLPPIA